MRLASTARATAGVIAVIFLSTVGLSPAVAADPAVTDEPTAAATTTPTPMPTPSPSAGVLSLKFGDKTAQLPLPGLSIPGIGSLDLNARSAPTAAVPQFGGGASGGHVEVHVGDTVQVKTADVGALRMNPDGGLFGRTAARVVVPSIEAPGPLPVHIIGLIANGVTVTTSGYKTYPDNRPSAWARTEVSHLSSDVYFANLTADGIHAQAEVTRLPDGQYRIAGWTQFAYLSIAGAVNQQSKDIAPNTTYQVSGLGTVVLNEQKITQLPRDRYGMEVNAIHVTLDTATYGLPAGSEIYIGSAEAIVYDR